MPITRQALAQECRTSTSTLAKVIQMYQLACKVQLDPAIPDPVADHIREAFHYHRAESLNLRNGLLKSLGRYVDPLTGAEAHALVQATVDLTDRLHEAEEEHTVALARLSIDAKALEVRLGEQAALIQAQTDLIQSLHRSVLTLEGRVLEHMSQTQEQNSLLHQIGEWAQRGMFGAVSTAVYLEESYEVRLLPLAYSSKPELEGAVVWDMDVLNPPEPAPEAAPEVDEVAVVPEVEEELVLD